jgi:hypothetical protein
MRATGIYETPATNMVIVPLRQCSHGMKMVRQYHDGIDRKWSPRKRLPENRSQHIGAFDECFAR